jgi:ATP-binding cassette subfamily C (CFTR/MRP) protein 1
MIMNSARTLQKAMLSSIMRSKMQFFESTPLGRIINRFSKDMNSIEFFIPRPLRECVYCLFDSMTAITVISITTPSILLLIVPTAILGALIQVRAAILPNYFDLNFC